MIISSIKQRYEDSIILEPSGPKKTEVRQHILIKHNFHEKHSSSLSLSFSKQLNLLLLKEESLDGMWALPDQHRSLSKEERIIGGLQNDHIVKTRRLESSVSQARLEKTLVKTKEIEYYRKDQFADQTAKLSSFDELRERKSTRNREEKKFRAQKLKMIDKLHRETARREESSMRKVRSPLHYSAIMFLRLGA
jgi:hypothetical protein